MKTSQFTFVILVTVLASCSPPAQSLKQESAQKPAQSQPPKDAVRLLPEFWGHRIGETIPEFYKVEKRKPPANPELEVSFKTGKKDEWGTDETGTAVLSDGHLVMLSLLALSKDYGDAVDDTTSKVGVPTSTKEEVLENAFGATWTVHITYWNVGATEIKISQLRSFGAKGADITIGEQGFVTALEEEQSKSSGSHNMFDK